MAIADKITSIELDALRSSIEALNARMQRYTHSSKLNQLNEQRQISARRKSHVADNQISQLKASLEKLSLTNSENTKKVKLVESALKTREASSS